MAVEAADVDTEVTVEAAEVEAPSSAPWPPWRRPWSSDDTPVVSSSSTDVEVLSSSPASIEVDVESSSSSIDVDVWSSTEVGDDADGVVADDVADDEAEDEAVVAAEVDAALVATDGALEAADVDAADDAVVAFEVLTIEGRRSPPLRPVVANDAIVGAAATQRAAASAPTMTRCLRVVRKLMSISRHEVWRERPGSIRATTKGLTV